MLDKFVLSFPQTRQACCVYFYNSWKGESKEGTEEDQWQKKPILQEGELVIFPQEQEKTSTCVWV